MDFFLRHTVEIGLILLVAPTHAYWALRHGGRFQGVWICGALALLAFGLALESVRIQNAFPVWVYPVVRAIYLSFLMISTGCLALRLLFRWILGDPERHSPQRRKLLQAAHAVPAAVLGYGAFIERDRFEIKHVDVPIAGLPKQLDGLRLVQITDVHIGAYLTEREFARVIDMANELRPHLAIMTGDLVTKRGDPVDHCLRQLARLKADAGLLGCMGNHEIYAGAQEYVEREAARLGMEFLRQRSKTLIFNGKPLHFVGVDYQSKRLGPYLEGAESLVQPGGVNVLLSHNPDVFRVAPEKGFQVTLSGHTHGGQIAVEFLNPYLNVARFVTPYVAGYYHQQGASLYVSRGVGTIGVPSRVGVPPEVTDIRLCAI